MNILEYTFFQNALAGAFLASILCGFIGTYIVTRRLVFISGGITHASFGGIGIGVFAGINPILSAMIFAILSAFGVQWTSSRKDIRQDSAIAMFWTLGMSVGIICCFLTPGFLPDLPSFLRQHSHHRHRRSLAVGHSHGICLHTLYSFSTTHPKCGIRPHLFSFAASSRRPDRIYDDGTHRHDHRRHPQDGGYSPCHQSAYHSTDDGQYLHLQLQAAYPLQHHRGLVRLPHRAPLQLSVQCSLRSHHHLCKYPHFCPLQDNKSRHISVL